MKKNKTIALALASALSLSLLAGCSTKEQDSPVVLTINGVDILASEYSYTLNSAYLELSNQHNQLVSQLPEGAQIPFSYSDNFEKAQEMATSTIKRNVVMNQILVENKIPTSEDVVKFVEDDIANAKDQMGIQTFKQTLRTMGTTEEAYLENALIVPSFLEAIPEIYGNGSKTDEELYAIYDNEYMKAQHILISFEPVTAELSEEQSKEKAKKTAESVLAEIAKGEQTFDELIKTYSQDPGQPSAGYAFLEGDMVIEFENAVKELEPDQVSGLVETAYGYHIIKTVVENQANFDANKERIQTGSGDKLAVDAVEAKALEVEVVETDIFTSINSENYIDYFIIED